nr:MAG: hypothetical protein [Lokiarchaeota virus Skoll Meg22_1214]
MKLKRRKEDLFRCPNCGKKTYSFDLFKFQCYCSNCGFIFDLNRREEDLFGIFSFLIKFLKKMRDSVRFEIDANELEECKDLEENE